MIEKLESLRDETSITGANSLRTSLRLWIGYISTSSSSYRRNKGVRSEQATYISVVRLITLYMETFFRKDENILAVTVWGRDQRVQ